ncbi:hypothetical protein EN794_004575 [Mesorhizobium sp. M00.F.Ca.ET.151.01.1.1]|nr:hypothetical protein EN842_05230 [bacterium M00.F.Ca.ET.199.01.1.1]TGT08748.1 hypothetical protein EN820_00415 [bacterium M00.F.Ca.ET.177.01.1.1]TGT66682.1 hypothetical protein EN813_000415 [Mesorhizobium sp. M00.F.Ca.ET.170.01.1.1]TGU15595.1 hypothetical protein EN806_00415 [bacterium M00.F.Ca.ET.163.01.1.1]TGU98321.1 hypothetical protein EN794_004575 [Mesorhizobium sp. M00.F.Ca.ET.151.01.1.1]TGV59987.1 hypothetical protein EN784_05965 [bacterium M00.F.Ca.ET.141.01.1.1]
MDCSWIGWCALTASEQAAWVQAVGSVLAIGVAIAVPLVIARRDRKRRDAEAASRARTYALHLMPLVELLYSKLRSAHLLVLDHNEEDLGAAITMVREGTAPDGWGLHLHELGAAGDQLQKALAAARTALELMNDLEHYLAFSGTLIDEETGEEIVIPPPGPVLPELERAIRLTQEARSALRSLFK